MLGGAVSQREEDPWGKGGPTQGRTWLTLCALKRRGPFIMTRKGIWRLTSGQEREPG